MKGEGGGKREGGREGGRKKKPNRKVELERWLGFNPSSYMAGQNSS